MTISLTDPFTGLVERTGLFWLEEIPLADGANALTVTATDATGNSSSTNITVVKSDVALIINDYSGADLTQGKVSVSGTVDAGAYTVWVNGIRATDNGGGAWSAGEVPIPLGGTAVVQARAIPNTDNNGNGIGGGGPPAYENLGNPFSAQARDAEAAPEVPARDLYVDHYHRSTSDVFTLLNPASWDSYLVQLSNFDWQDAGGGKNTIVASFGARFSNDVCVTTQIFPTNRWPNLEPGCWDTLCQVQQNSSGEDVMPVINFEHMDYKDLVTAAPGAKDYHTMSCESQATVKIQTGGRAGGGKKSLYVITADATAVFYEAWRPWLESEPPAFAVPPTQIEIGGLGKLGSDGRLYVALPDNTTVDITPRVAGFNNYTFRPGAQKHKLRILANGSPLDKPQAPKFCVGQKIVLTTSFDPEPPGIASVSAVWNLPGEYRNAKKYPFGMDYYVATCYPRHVWVAEQLPFGVLTPCTYYLIHEPLLREESTGAWWISKGKKKVGSSKTISFSNGQEVTVMFFGSFEVLSPTVRISDVLPRYFTGSWYSGVSLGDYSIQDGGMAYSVIFASDFGGTGAITQLIQADYDIGPNFTDYRLDGPELYSQGQITPLSDPSSFKFVHFDDFPGTPGHRLKADFRDYVRFKPDGDDDIYATVATIHWNIYGEMTVGGTWTHRETPPPDGPTPSTDFPLWTHSFP